MAFTDPYEYENDILSNRLSRGYDFDHSGTYATYAWDDVNRMKKHVNVSSGGAKYKYRADGQRVEKVTGVSLTWYIDPINDSAHYDEVTLVNRPTTRYYHDGQMLMEEDYDQAGIPTIGDPDPDPVHSGLISIWASRGNSWIHGVMFGLGVLCGFYNAFFEAAIISIGMGE